MFDPSTAHGHRVSVYFWGPDDRREGVRVFEGRARWTGTELLLEPDAEKAYPIRVLQDPRPVPYLQAVCDPLAKTLDHAAGLHVRLLVGYAANFDFWWDEVRHALRLIEGYRERFKRFEDAQLKYAEFAGYTELPDVQPTVKAGELRETRRRVVDALTRFAKRCEKENLVEPGKVKAALSTAV